MTDREENIQNMFISTVQFDTVNFNDYKDLLEAVAQFTAVRQVVDAIADYSSTQVSGARGRAVEQKSVLDAAIRRKMKRYSRTARALNIDDPGFRRLFTIPDENNYALVAATAREFVEQARRFVAEFAGLGIPAALADELEADVELLEAAISSKAGANTEKVGATTGIDEQIERGMQAEIRLDAIMHNVYFDNPVKLSEWKSARHVKRAPKPKTEPKPE